MLENNFFEGWVLQTMEENTMGSIFVDQLHNKLTN